MEPIPPIERRREVRRPITGEVHIRQRGSHSSSFLGHLIDASSTGFCIRHDRLTLAAGHLVDFERPGHSGRARAIWTRIVGSEAETGFHVVQSD